MEDCMVDKTVASPLPSDEPIIEPAPEHGPGEPEKENPPETIVEPAETPASKPADLFTRFRSWLFNLHSRPGFVRRVGYGVAVFALGVICSYVILAMPAQRQFESVQSRLAGSDKQLNSVKSTLETTQKERDNLQVSTQQLQETQKKNGQHILLLQCQVSVTRAEIDLANRDGATALLDLKAAQTCLDQLTPVMSQQNSELGASLKNHLAQATSELTRDPATSASLLKTMSDDLSQLEISLFKAP
jgi:uncharacterized membrane-anchored protein YhcB (DUF1043 family)